MLSISADLDYPLKTFWNGMREMVQVTRGRQLSKVWQEL